MNLKNMLEEYRGSKVSEQTQVREVLQQMALLGLERQGFFKEAAFYGGTALRILYGLDRFSEDLDFTLLKANPQFNFVFFLEGMRRELLSFGFDMEVKQKVKQAENTILSAFMKINTIQLLLSIQDETKARNRNHNEKIQIKLEIDVNPPPLFRVATQWVHNPVSFGVLTLHQSDLFAGKMHAILYRAWKGRIKGRDWYDLNWYIRKKIPLGLRYLESCMHQAGNLPLQERLDIGKVRNLLANKIETLDWQSAKDDVRNFISDPRTIEIWSPEFFTSLLEHLQVES